MKKSYREASNILNVRSLVQGNEICFADQIQNINDKHVHIINKAKKYVEDNIGADIALTEVANHVALSANYFCNLFKQKTGNNLLDYIVSEKMEKARSYVITTNLKIYEIARLVGYNDSKYFCTVFKKFFHCNPTELRND